MREAVQDYRVAKHAFALTAQENFFKLRVDPETQARSTSTMRFEAFEKKTRGDPRKVLLNASTLNHISPRLRRRFKVELPTIEGQRVPREPEDLVDKEWE